MANPSAPTTIDAYLRPLPPEIRKIMQSIRELVNAEVPDAQELISYRMPAFRRGRIFLYFAAFKKHIGIFPPVHGTPALEKALEPFRGPKGNLRFPLDRPIPLPLIRRVIKALAKEYSSDKPRLKGG